MAFVRMVFQIGLKENRHDLIRMIMHNIWPWFQAGERITVQCGDENDPDDTARYF